MTFNIITFGCKVNSYESESIKEQLLNKYKYNEDYKTSDIVIVNTCSVTNTADNKCKKQIRSVRRDNPHCILVVCGCSSENHREEFNDLNIDILIGNSKKSQITSLIEEYIDTNDKLIYFDTSRVKEFENMSVKSFSDLTRAYIKIEDGCNNYCSYCVIPYVRGSIRSKKMDLVIEEAKELVNSGHKEIVLTGINLGAYGKEKKQYDLVDLIRELSKIEKLERIRISSIEMTEITDKFIEELALNKKICGHLHISLQSGSDKILKLMNRKYTSEEYLNNINKIKKARPNINLTTDVIVGFPGETEEDFRDCIDFCKKVGFSKIHVFPYSKRDQTASATMKNQLDNTTKKNRARKLIAIDEQMQKEFHEKYLNQKVDVLIEEVNDNTSIGHTENYIKVEIPTILNKNETYTTIVTEVYVDKVLAKLDI